VASATTGINMRPNSGTVIPRKKRIPVADRA
jgi:hypothetical protein